MSVKNFKFVSPGVFINEIDNSFIPRTPDAIGPVIIGRSAKGPAMQPTKVESFSDFVTMFGDTVPGNRGGDVYREGNHQSPMYGTYAAKAFLASNAAPLTYVRLLGQQNVNKRATSEAKAGWQTATQPVAGGGAYGLFLIKSSSVTGAGHGHAATDSSAKSANNNLGTMNCAAIWYLDNGSIQLSGAVWGSGGTTVTASAGCLIESDANGKFKAMVAGTAQGAQTFTFNFDDNSEDFIRNQFNTNPQLIGSGDYYPTSAEVDYWLGETFEQDVRDKGATGVKSIGIIVAIGSGSATAPSVGPQKMKGQASREAVAGWFVGQDMGVATAFKPTKTQKLFRLKGRGHGEWLNKNVKISIDRIKQSTTTSSPYGTFSVLLRNINDTDSNVQIIERFDNLTLDPTSPNFIARKIGDRYNKWDSTNRTLRQYGEYDNKSDFVYVELAADVAAGATDSALLPFGYYGPPRLNAGTPRSEISATGSSSTGAGRPGIMIQHSASFSGFAQPVASFKVHASTFVNGGGGSATASFQMKTAAALGAGAPMSASLVVALTSSGGTVRKYRFIGGAACNGQGAGGGTVRPLTASNGSKLPGSGLDALLVRTSSIAVHTGSKNKTTLQFLKEAVESTNGHNGKLKCGLDAAGTTLTIRQAKGGKKGTGTAMQPKSSSIGGQLGRTNAYAIKTGMLFSAHGNGTAGSPFAMTFRGPKSRDSGLSGGLNGDRTRSSFTASMVFPYAPLRLSASNGGLTDPTNAYFGMRTTRTTTSDQNSYGIFDMHRLLYSGFPDDPTSGADTAGKGVKEFSYIFTMDDIRRTNATGSYYYQSGSRKADTSVSATAITGGYKALLDAGYDRFTAPMWGGFDGWDINKPDPAANSLMATSDNEETNYVFNTYRQALETVADPEMIDMNLLATPGLTNTALTRLSVEMCEDRADSMALIDLPNVYTPPHETYRTKDERASRSIVNAANNLRDRRLDSSYGATFYPWVQTRDAFTGQNVWIPPTVAMMGVLGSSEAKDAVWFAPAGFNRGGLSDGAAGIPITNVTTRLSSKDRDTLYDARINPIASFPSTGIVVFGQKTLQGRQSALDRINVRRLVIYLKKQISVLSTQILFEQNVQSTWDRFKGLVEPFLANVKTLYGISEYRLILDESTTTPDLIDQNIMYAKIMIKPARAIEFIAIDFVIASTGASFDD
jgi:hypothetical protein